MSEKEEKDLRCEHTKFARLNRNGVISPIYSFRNRPNEKGICYLHGKKAGQLKKNKAIDE